MGKIRSTLARGLLAWYRAQRRELPWRETRDPYETWIGETLAQQTRLVTALPFFERFMARFPTVEALAEAPLDAVLKTWEGAGYYARARNLQKGAQRVMREFGGKLPARVEELHRLEGIGPYTAGAVASIAFGLDAAALDGNGARVLARIFAIREAIDEPATRARLWMLAESLLPRGEAGDFNQALMDLGATICTPRRPRCHECPVRRNCRARRLGIQEELPVKRAKKARPHYEIGLGLVWKRGRVLIQQRAAEGLLGGLWEFPGGKQEAGESLAECVRREAREELGIEVEVGEEVAVVPHTYTHFSVRLHAFRCAWASGRARPLAATRVRWARPGELEAFAFPAANRKIIRRMLSSQ